MRAVLAAANGNAPEEIRPEGTPGPGTICRGKVVQDQRMQQRSDSFKTDNKTYERLKRNVTIIEWPFVVCFRNGRLYGSGNKEYDDWKYCHHGIPPWVPNGDGLLGVRRGGRKFFEMFSTLGGWT